MGVLLDEGGSQLFGEGGEILYDEGGPGGGDIVPPSPDLPTVQWTYVLGGPAPLGVEYRELTQATGRNLTMRVDAPWTAQFSLDGRSDEAAQITALATDLHIYRNGLKIFRGRITTESDTVTETSHACQFSAVDYRGMLAYRVIGTAGRTFTAVDQADIGWTLIAESQAQLDGDWGIVNGIGATSGSPRDRTYDPGKPLLDAISELGRVDDGFEWEISPLLAFNRWYPQRGTDNAVVLDYGGKVRQFSRLLQGDDFANFVVVTGGQGLTPVSAVGAGLATDPRGRWETSVGYTSVVEQSTLASKAAWLRDYASTLRPEIRAKFNVNRWGGLSDVSLGDTITLGLRSGRLSDAIKQRVVEILCVPGDHGTESIDVGLVAA